MAKPATSKPTHNPKTRRRGPAPKPSGDSPPRPNRPPLNPQRTQIRGGGGQRRNPAGTALHGQTGHLETHTQPKDEAEGASAETQRGQPPMAKPATSKPTENPKTRRRGPAPKPSVDSPPRPNRPPLNPQRTQRRGGGGQRQNPAGTALHGQTGHL